MEKEFNIFASYSQVSVFHAALENPFNEWTSELIAQGFSWRVGSVAFKLPEESGDLVVKVAILDEFRQYDASLRIIRVPFIVPKDSRHALTERQMPFNTTECNSNASIMPKLEN